MGQRSSKTREGKIGNSSDSLALVRFRGHTSGREVFVPPQEDAYFFFQQSHFIVVYLQM